MTQYTIGFLFNKELNRVVLIRKTKPSWQRGKLNGVGGHVEAGETPDVTMAREFSEEVDHRLIKEEIKWQGYATMTGSDFQVFCFAATAEHLAVDSKTEEEVVTHAISEIRNFDLVENLEWLIHLAIDNLQDGRPVYCEVQYP